MQSRQAQRAAEIARRQEIYGRCLDELVQIIGLAMAANAVDYPKMAGLFALEGRICLFGRPEGAHVVRCFVGAWRQASPTHSITQSTGPWTS